MTSELVIRLTAGILGFAIFLQSAELFFMRKTIGDSGIWRWSILRSDWKGFPRIIQSLAEFIFSYRNFVLLSGLRLVLAVVIVFYHHWSVIFTLFLLSLLTSIRFRGVLNGGSDYMTIIVLTGLLVSTLIENPTYKVLGIYYIGVFSVASYFIAGLAKANDRGWLSGRTLMGFILNSSYGSPNWLRKWTSIPALMCALGILTLGFELLFPVVLFKPQALYVFLPLAFLFHLSNSIAFGLQRFTWIWLATYPSIVFVSFRLSIQTV